jgi:hypothetical protein
MSMAVPRVFAFRASPTGVLRRRSDKRSRAEAVRRVGGASGPGGAALKTYRKFSQGLNEMDRSPLTSALILFRGRTPPERTPLI